MEGRRDDWEQAAFCDHVDHVGAIYARGKHRISYTWPLYFLAPVGVRVCDPCVKLG